jgi:hypothetical protein
VAAWRTAARSGTAWALSCALGCGALGCGAVDRDALRVALDAHDLTKARALVDDALGAGGAKGGSGSSEANAAGAASDTPKRTDGQYALTLLERAIVRAAQGEPSGASADLSLADRALGAGDIARNARTRALRVPAGFRYSYLRGWSQALNIPPGLKFYEWLMLNPLGALFRLDGAPEAHPDANADEKANANVNADEKKADANANAEARAAASSACVEARRFGAVADWTTSVAAGRADGVRAFGELVTALACDAADPALACGALRRAGSLATLAARARVARRCSGEAAASGESDAGTVRSGTTGDPGGEIVVFAAYGRVSHPVKPRKDTPVKPSGGPETEPDPALAIRVDGVAAPASEVLDLEAAVQEDFRESQHSVEVTILGVKALTGEWSIWAWELLPSHVAMAVIPATPGAHEVEMTVRGEVSKRRVEVPVAGSRVIIGVVPW